MRFYPQSFELSTLGGWIATRAGGHFAIGPTHVDDLVEAVRAITPTGTWASRRLPGSGAGPSPDRMLLGSEGILGVITEAWVRVQPRPSHRAGRDGALRLVPGRRRGGARRRPGRPAARQLPAHRRARGRSRPAAGDGERAVLVLGFESTDHDVEHELARALELCRAHGGEPDEPAAGGRDGAGAWREAFLRMPYLRDMLVRLGILTDTFETAITWERLPAFHEAVVGATRAALGERCRVTCRLTHVYPDGPAPYFTVLAPARRGDELEQWLEMKSAASDAILAAGGTITHHHAVGRDHRRWYDAQRPEPFAAALRAAKAAVDPKATPQPRGTLGSMSAEGKNFEAITKAKADHNARCPFPPHTVRMNPFEIERMQWEEGDTIAGLVLEGDPKVGTGAFRLVCDGMEPPELEIEEVEAISAPVEPLEVPVGPGPPRRADRLRVAIGSRGIGISGPNGAARRNLR